MKFEKPGPKPKKNPKAKQFKTHSIEKPDDLQCRRCGKTTETECFRHYEGIRKSEFGKGTSQKGNDRITAWMCSKCDSIMSDNAPGKESPNYVRISHSEEWLYLIAKTWLI